jgi:hypothetical protein
LLLLQLLLLLLGASSSGGWSGCECAIGCWSAATVCICHLYIPITAIAAAIAARLAVLLLLLVAGGCIPLLPWLVTRRPLPLAFPDGSVGVPVWVSLCMLADDFLCKLVCRVEQPPAVAAQHLVQPCQY